MTQANSPNSSGEPRPFEPKRTCTYQQHAARIEQLLREGYHDGKRWKPEAHDRYAKLEIGDYRDRANTAAPNLSELSLVQLLEKLQHQWPYTERSVIEMALTRAKEITP